ncbi:ATP-binding protein [Verminephrobacter eiseniae]|nr:ATP-binding protein [Verminephrobacter eiseniae]MCW5294337.1 ATP-binding protein [Verminephrobacter eiseniae]MCW8186711.1 ATP-binding protein [Verminephrobacter eiseniae]MCW8225115.1 ATP-binding protein [Verminephrobacter eiseniae]MCW8234052.1 ATP-binding protein [Verminephrobacter eiseniae]
MGELHLQEGHLYFLLGLGLLVLSYVLLLRLGVHHLESLLHPVLRMVRLYGARDSIQMPEPSLPVVHQLVMAAQQLIRHLIGDATLVGNAIKYGGSAHIHLSETSKGAAIRVTDPGPGVPEEMLAKVFEPFVRLNRCGPSSGTGLGLTIARNLVHAHGGDIQLSNRPEGGLEAMFTLPVSLRQTSA